MITIAVAVPVQSVQVSDVNHMKQSTFVSVVNVMLKYTAHNTQQKQNALLVSTTDNKNEQIQSMMGPPSPEIGLVC